jgi:mannobiose 2-epimerase
MTIARIGTARSRIQKLGTASAQFWKRHGLDEVNGGFRGSLDENGTAIAPEDKGLIQQARHLWTLSTWYAHQEPTPEVKALADNVYSFLMKHFYDAASKEFVFKVTRQGKTIERKKVLYAQSFTIYGLAEYARVFDQRAALQTALELFHAIGARAHDDVHGGYDQRGDAYWMPEGSEKETNTHIHLMEAFTTLYEISSDSAVRERLAELVAIVTQKICRPEGYAHKDFKLDWSLVGDPIVSYGHDIETFWLVDSAARALGKQADEAIMGPARHIGMSSAEWGFDPEHGGYFEEGPLGGAPTKREKIWWIQAEALPALFRLYEQTRDELYLDRLEKTLDFIEQKQLAPSGEWYWGVFDDGRIGPIGDGLGQEWKAGYHVLRALVFTDEWMGQWLASTGAGRARSSSTIASRHSRRASTIRRRRPG